MEKKAILIIALPMLITGCVPTVVSTKKHNIDRFEKNIKIVADIEVKEVLKKQFLLGGWNVKDKIEPKLTRYVLNCESKKESNKYNIDCELKDINDNTKIAKVKTILFKNTLSQTARVVYDKINEEPKLENPTKREF